MLKVLGIISDVAGIISCFVTFILFILSHSLLKNSTEQRIDYNNERISIQSDLISLRDNIWEDNLDTLKIRS